MTRFFAIATLTLLPALSACGDEPAPVQGDDGREASGEVLEGSISDAMLPIDGVQSQAPLAAPEPGEGGSAPVATGSSTSDGVEDEAPAQPAAPVEPDPEPSPPPVEPAAE